MKKIFWNPGIAEDLIFQNAEKILDRIGETLLESLKPEIPEGDVTRPMYKSGPYKDKWWTARDAGGLKRSARITKDGSGRSHNIRIIVGNTKHYYGKIVNFGTNGNKYKGFFSKGINKGKRKVRTMMNRGGVI